MIFFFFLTRAAEKEEGLEVGSGCGKGDLRSITKFSGRFPLRKVEIQARYLTR